MPGKQIEILSLDAKTSNLKDKSERQNSPQQGDMQSPLAISAQFVVVSAFVVANSGILVSGTWCSVPHTGIVALTETQGGRYYIL